MPAELTGYDVFAKLLLNTLFVVLRDLDNAVYVAVDISFVDVL